MTAPTYTAEAATALAHDFRLMASAAAALPSSQSIAEYVHIERNRRVYEWAVESGMSDVPPPCCPYQCDCGEEPHTCLEDDLCILPTSVGLDWVDEDGDTLVAVSYEVLWAQDADTTETYIEMAVEAMKDNIRALAEARELQERGILAQLQHKYEDSK